MLAAPSKERGAGAARVEKRGAGARLPGGQGWPLRGKDIGPRGSIGVRQLGPELGAESAEDGAPHSVESRGPGEAPGWGSGATPCQASGPCGGFEHYPHCF